MDKVVHGNVSSAEESAAASEEMTAQAEQLKELITCLVTVVNGVAKGRIQRLKDTGINSGKTVELSRNPSDQKKLIG